VWEQKLFYVISRKKVPSMEKEIWQEILERIVRIETKIDGYNSLREKLDTTSQITHSNKEDILELKDSQKWLSRTVVGAVIVSIISMLIKFVG